MTRLKRLVHEVHRRSLWQVLSIYVLGAWIGYEAIEALVAGLGLPDWFPALAVVLFIIGLPIVLATAFVQEGRPLTHARDPTLLPDASSGSQVATGSGEPERVRRILSWRNALGGGVVAFALWGIVAAVWLLIQGTDAAQNTVEWDTASVAVLPFLNMSADTANEYFSDGVTEEIISALSKVRDLRVVSRSATFRYKGVDVDPRDVGRELGVSAILEGSVRRDADRVRITAQLISVNDGFHLWSENYNRRYEAIFDIQLDVAQRIAEALRLSLTESDRQLMGRRATEDLEAYELYTRGRHEFYKYTLDGNSAAVKLYQDALERDGNFALAWAGLSLAYSQYINRGWSRDEDWLDKAEVAARKALEVDRDLAEAHFALGFVYEKRQRYDLEESEMKVVLVQNPNHAHAHDSLGDVYFWSGQLEEALREYAVALRLDPFLPPSHYRSGEAHRWAGQYDQALETYRRGLALLPDLELFNIGIGDVLRAKADDSAAIHSYEAAIGLGQFKPEPYIGIALSQLAMDDPAGARSTAERLLRVDSSSAWVRASHSYILGQVTLADGDAEGALAFFENAADLDPPSIFNTGFSSLRLYDVAMAEAQLARGDAQGAAERLRGLLDLAPWHRELRYKLALALEEAGDTEEAAALYRAFLTSWRDADPDAASLIDAKARLAALSSSP